MLVECVPNFSEGRRPEVLQQILDAITAVPGVALLGHAMDADHNRAVVTLAGEGEAVVEGAFRGIAKAAELIDLREHQGEHPRMGATDVVPFIPLGDTTMEQCVALATTLARRVGEELQIPTFLYESAATRPERQNLAKVRKGQFEGLRDAIGTDPDRDPDFGPRAIHASAGATAIGARFFLIAYNVNLDSEDVAIAKTIGTLVREKDGGLPSVKAMGFELTREGRTIGQVSMNLVDYRVTSPARARRPVAIPRAGRPSSRRPSATARRSPAARRRG
jgi:glutamate formiminotransferase